MNLKTIFANNKTIYIFLVLFTFLIMLNSSYNPLHFTRMNVDSSVYVTIAQGIVNGKMPYADMPDNKGPLLYLINAAGWKVGGFNGIWFIEFLFMCITVFFMYKTALFFGDRFKALLGTVFCLFILNSFMHVNAGTESYSMPFLMISIYIFTKFYLLPEQKVNFLQLILLGFCFTAAIMIRINVFPLWAGFCAVIFFECIIKKRFLLLGKYILGFFLGIVIAGIPIFLYLSLNGIIDDFFLHVIFGGVSRGFGGGGLKKIFQNFFIVLSRHFSIIPFIIGIYWIIIKFKHDNFLYYFGFFLSCFLMFLFHSFSVTLTHSSAIMIPFFIPSITFLIGIIYSAFSQRKYKNILTIIFFCLLFSDPIVNYLYDASKTFRPNSDTISGNYLINAGKMIDTHTKPGDKIISLGYNAYIYPFTQREPVSKYFFQSGSFNFVPDSRDEFISDVLTNKPSIIVLYTADDEKNHVFINSYWHDPILQLIETDYRVLSDENGFLLWIRN